MALLSSATQYTHARASGETNRHQLIQLHLKHCSKTSYRGHIFIRLTCEGNATDEHRHTPWQYTTARLRFLTCHSLENGVCWHCYVNDSGTHIAGATFQLLWQTLICSTSLQAREDTHGLLCIHCKMPAYSSALGMAWW